MLYLKSSPTGIDKIIQEYQQRLYSKLTALWNISDNNFWDCYGRAYKNNTDTGYKVQVWESSLPGYKDLIFEDSKGIISFFSGGHSTDYKFGKTIAKGSLIFTMNIEKVKSSIIWRPDEEVKVDILRQLEFIKKELPGIYYVNITGFETGFENVFKDYPGMITKDTKTYMDTYPFWNLKINVDIFYNMF